MKALFLFFFTLSFMAMAGQNREREEAEKAFLTTLQTAFEIGLQQTDPGEPVCTIDSAFAISNDGILSLTLRFQQQDSSYYIQRYAVPVKVISHVFYDVYLGLECYNEAIYIRRSKKNTTYFNQYAQTRLWHIGMLPVGKGEELKEKLFALVRTLRKMVLLKK